MIVKHGDCVVHKIEKNHFIQSVEWTARRHQSALDQYQVRVEVEEAPAAVLHINHDILDTILETRPDLSLILECLVAKDVSMKLYMMNKTLADMEDTNKRKSRKSQPSESSKKSSSADAINTGWKGENCILENVKLFLLM